MSKGNLHEEQVEKEEKKQFKKDKYLKDISKEIYKLEEKFVDREMFYKYFGFEMPSKMLAKLIKSNNEHNIKFAALINKDLK